MKAKQINTLWILSFVAGPIAISSAVAQQASTTEWNADPETPADWSDNANWSAGLPVADSLAGILNGGIVNVISPTAVLEQLRVAGGSTLNISALLEIEGTNRIVNPEPDPATPATGLFLNAGIINVMEDGDLRVLTGGDFSIGFDAQGTLNLMEGGSLTTDRTVNVGRGEFPALGGFVLSGGSLVHTGTTFQVGPNNSGGTVDISGGAATINGLRVNHGGTDSSLTNIFNQTGGEITFNGETAVGWDTVGSATYNLLGGKITTANRIRIGVSNKGDATRVNIFNHAGGDVNVTGRIDIGDNAPPVVSNIYDFQEGYLKTTGNIQVGAFGSSSGVLKLRGLSDTETLGIYIGTNADNSGTVTVDEDARAFITNLEVRNGSFSQKGEFSDVFVTGRLWVGASQTVTQSATMTISDGTLRLPNNTLVGNSNAGNATFNIEGGTITTTDRFRIGNGAADGSLTPTNLVNQTGGEVTITGRLDLGERPGPTNIYRISGGSLTTGSNVLVGYFNDGTGVFEVSGDAEVDVPAVVMGENAGPANVAGTMGTVRLLGGTLTTGQIRVGNGIAEDQFLVLNGGTIRARSGGTTLIGANVINTSLLSGGVTFDTDGLDVATSGIMSGPGGVTKTGSGTLTVNGVQAYTGTTRVEGGTLRLMQPYLADNGDVYLTTGALLDLEHNAIDTIGTLFIDDEPQPFGTYGGSESTAENKLDELIIGTGVLNSTASVAPSEPPVVRSITVAGGVATITIRGAPNTTYACRFSDDLVTPFEPITTIPETVTTDANGDATFTVDAGVDSRFYKVGGVE